MALEAVQAQAGHRSIESARVYLHLTNDWLAGGVPARCRAPTTTTVAGMPMVAMPWHRSVDDVALAAKYEPHRRCRRSP
jgi:hypothetical protein